MKKVFFILGLFTLCVIPCISQSELDMKLDNLALQITQTMLEQKKTKLAVIEFSDLNGNIIELGKFLSEELITKLFITGKFEVVERQLLTKVIAEYKLNFTGIVDPESVKQLGKILGVDAIACGTIADLGDSIRVNAKLIRVETALIFGVAAVEIYKDKDIKKLLQKISVSLKPNQEKEPTRQRFIDGEIFFRKDFSNYEVGDSLQSWGSGVVVLAGSDKIKYMGSQIEGVHLVSQRIDFPQNWIFMIMIKAHGCTRENRRLRFIDEAGEELVINLWRDNVPDRWIVQLPGTQKVDFPAREDQYHEIKLVKQGDLYKFFIDSVYILSYFNNQFGLFKEVKFNVVNDPLWKEAGSDHITLIMGKAIK